MTDRLTIAVDAKRLFHNKEGLGQYARTLMKAMQEQHPKHQYVLCTPTISNAYPYFLDEDRFTILQAPTKSWSWYWRQKGIVKDLKKLDVDIYIGLSNEIPKGLRSANIKSVVSIHDLLYKTFPKQFSAIDRLIYHRKFTHATKEADAIMVTSKSTKADLHKYHKVTSKSVHVIYQSTVMVEDDIVPLDQRSHFLAVGTINERKNLDLLVEGYKRLPEAGRKRVIVIGKGKKYEVKLRQKVKEYGLEEHFDFKGHVSSEDLYGLYRHAIALIFPSKYEGFGRPVVEALSLGTPVITGNNSSLPEVVGKHGIIIEYDRPELLTEAMVEITKISTSEQLLKDRKHHLKQFTPKEHIKLIMNMLAQII